MSPAKPSTLSPHPHVQLPHQQQQAQPVSVSPCPPTSIPMNAAAPSQQTTLQALEQMVIPGVANPNVPSQDYGQYQSRPPMSHPPNILPQSSAQNPMGPLVTGPRMPMPSQWPPAPHQASQPQPQPQAPQIRPTMNLNDGRGGMMESHLQPPQPHQPPPPVVSEQNTTLYPMNGSESIHSAMEVSSREPSDIVQSSVHSLSRPPSLTDTELPNQTISHHHQQQQLHQQQQPQHHHHHQQQQLHQQQHQQPQSQLHQPHQQQSSQNQMLGAQDLLGPQQRDSSLHSGPQVNAPIEPASINTGLIEPVQSLPATSTSNSSDSNTTSTALQQTQQQSLNSVPIQSSILSDKLPDALAGDQTSDINAAQQQQSICPTPPVAQPPITTQPLGSSQPPASQMSMEQSQMAPVSQSHGQLNQSPTQITQAADPTATLMSQTIPSEQSQTINQSQNSQLPTTVLGQPSQPISQSQAQSHSIQTPQVNVLSQSSTAVSPQIPDQSTQIQSSNQMMDQTQQVSDQMPNQNQSQSASILSQAPGQVPNQSSQVESSNELASQTSQANQNLVPDQSTQVQNQPTQIQTSAATAAIGATPQVQTAGQTPGALNSSVPPVSQPNSQSTIPAGQQGFGEYTNVPKTNSLYPSDVIGPQQTPQPYLPPGDTNAVINSTGMTNLNYMPPATTPIPPGFVNPLAPISHHQERAALQQQLQELYCMPPAPEVQEKIVNLQEKLQALQHHETNEQCNGGAQCILQTPLFTAPAVVDSPQVSSTTGRGRTKGSSKSKKARKKADKEAATPIVVQPEQPVSDNLVTPGDSSNIVDTSADSIEDMKPSSGGDEEEWTGKNKKSRPPRKPRKPKEPKETKETKIKKEKEVKAVTETKTKSKTKKKKETTPKRSKK